MPIIRQVLKGLAYAHEVQLSGIPAKDGRKTAVRGLVHRDVKPANIFLQRNPKGVVAKIGDYGLAKAFDLAGLSGHTVAGAVGGTPYFMPRQQVLKFKFARPEVDVWAAAASLYYMLTGNLPRDFKEEDDPWVTVLNCRTGSHPPARPQDPGETGPRDRQRPGRRSGHQDQVGIGIEGGVGEGSQMSSKTAT